MKGGSKDIKDRPKEDAKGILRGHRSLAIDKDLEKSLEGLVRNVERG